MYAFIRIKEIPPFNLSFLSVFIIKQCQILSNASSIAIEMIIQVSFPLLV